MTGLFTDNTQTTIVGASNIGQNVSKEFASALQHLLTNNLTPEQAELLPQAMASLQPKSQISGAQDVGHHVSQLTTGRGKNGPSGGRGI